MAFLRASLPEDYLETIRGRTLVLRAPVMADYAQWAELRALSREHLVPWEPAWSRDDLSKSMYRRRSRAYAGDVRQDQGYSFFIADAVTDTVLGGITLSNIRRGTAQIASLGYWIGQPYAGQGRMQEAVRTLMPFALRTLRLHRIEAATMLANAASIRVLEKTGFEREGMAKAYLKINGRWEDHILFARVGRPVTEHSGLGEVWQ
jgi:[ribosomal protein S5]-alanine N-acetyltransferase